MATAEAAAPTVVARSEQSVFERVDDVKDPRQEWRGLFSEVLGTFFLVLVAAGGSNPSKKGANYARSRNLRDVTGASASHDAEGRQ